MNFALIKHLFQEIYVLCSYLEQIKGDVTNKMLEWKSKGTELYQTLSKECYELMKECTPLAEIEKHRKEKQEITFNTWKKTL